MTLAMRHGDDPDIHFQKVDGIIHQLSILGQDTPDAVKMGAIAQRLPSEYDSILPTIDNMPNPTFDHMKSIVRKHYRRLSDNRNSTPTPTSDHAMIVCFHCKKPGHIQAHCRNKNRGHPASKDWSAHENDHKPGHHSNHGKLIIKCSAVAAVVIQLVFALRLMSLP